MSSIQVSAALGAYFLAMVLHPDVQRQAQEEIDRVVGNDRLPMVSDLDKLQYLNAVLKEVMRWHSVACLSSSESIRCDIHLIMKHPSDLPHYTTQDDHYEGYYIPKGSIVLANLWLVVLVVPKYHRSLNRTHRDLRQENCQRPQQLL